MDKTWIEKPQNTIEYAVGLSKFLDFAFEKAAVEDRIRCPCPKCGFGKWQTRDIVQDHLLLKPFPKNYVIWSRHGEKQLLEPVRIEVMQELSNQENPLDTMMNDAFRHYRHEATADEMINEMPKEDHSDFYEFVRDGNETLYEGSKCTKLEFIIKLYHIKVLCGLNDKCTSLAYAGFNSSNEVMIIP